MLFVVGTKSMTKRTEEAESRAHCSHKRSATAIFGYDDLSSLVAALFPHCNPLLTHCKGKRPQQHELCASTGQQINILCASVLEY